MTFSDITSRLQKELRSNNPQIRILLKNNPGMAFARINEIASDVGKHYNIKVSLNFPEKGKIEDYDSHGTENIGFVFYRNPKSFTISRESIKSKAVEIFGNAEIQDAYMYEGKEGVRVIDDNYRLDILPASLHVWGKITQSINIFCDWLFEYVYEVRPGV